MTMRLINILVLVLVITSMLYTQEKRVVEPRWWYGGMAGANINFHSTDIRTFNASLPTLANPFTKGSGSGLFLAPLIEYHADPMWGGILTLGFDSRRGSFDEAADTGGSSSLSTSIAYLSLEPSLRLAPPSSNFYVFAGPRIGFAVSKSFTLQRPNNPQIDGDWSGIRGTVLGAQFGIGYDLALTSREQETQVHCSPFIAVHFGQGPRSEENWQLTTVRLGVGLRFGSLTQAREDAAREVTFSVRAPRLIPIERKVKETFPLRNYVFFDEGSSAVPARYIRLTREQAASFKEEQLLQPQPKDLTGRSRRQLTAYHNLVNILGDRLRDNTGATVTLVGSSNRGSADGRILAESVRQYLIDVFGIDGARVRTEGREKPTVPSVQPGATRELELVGPEDRRVDISSTSTALMEPVQIVSLQEDPLDSDVLLNVDGAGDFLASWTVETKDDAGSVKRFGPFTSDQERISGRTILGDRLKGSYTVTLLAQTKDGQTIRKEEAVHLVRSDEPDEELGLRFSILFEFDQSKTVATYERFLTGTVAPLIADGGSVIIHGHTDIVGEESHNLKLSRDRSQETMSILEQALARAGKRKVKFDTYGFGEDVRRAPFENTLPEERFYNRTVIIDILPQ